MTDALPDAPQPDWSWAPPPFVNKKAEPIETRCIGCVPDHCQGRSVQCDAMDAILSSSREQGCR